MCRSRRSSSAAGARPPFRWSPRPELATRRVPGRHPVLGNHRRRRPERSASYAATRWPCCRSSATTSATTFSTGSTSAQPIAELLPKIFYVNWFRRGDDGEFLWPGFGENTRVLKWALQRIDGRATANPTPIGNVPRIADLDLTRLKFDRAKIAAALDVSPEEWLAETRLIDEWYATIGTNAVPDALRAELAALKEHLSWCCWG